MTKSVVVRTGPGFRVVVYVDGRAVAMSTGMWINRGFAAHSMLPLRDLVTRDWHRPTPLECPMPR